MPPEVLPVALPLKHQKLVKPEACSLNHRVVLSGTSGIIPASDVYTGLPAKEKLSASASSGGWTAAAELPETGPDHRREGCPGHYQRDHPAARLISSGPRKSAGMIQKLCVYNEVTCKLNQRHSKHKTTDNE